MTTHRSAGSRALWLAGLLFVALALAGCSGDDGGGTGGDRPTLRVGVLKFGTVNWELDTVQRRNLAKKRGVNIEVVPLASENGLAVALQGGRVDLIVSDWIWVARQRASDRDYQFVPYSKAVGAVMVNPASGISKIADLKGNKLGVAGGPVDKTWLLTRAYAQKTAGLDLENAVEPNFAAPPTINKLMLDGRLPAAINYWHYDARLSALGMKPLLTVKQMLHGLGIDTVPPLLGWVFSEDFAADHRKELKAFFDATYKAKHILATSDAAWKPLRSQVKPESDAVFAAIKQGYRDGIVQHYGAAEIAAAGQLFGILAQEGGGKLTGGVEQLSPDVFWDGFRLP